MYLVSGCARTASATAPTLLHKLLTSRVWAGWSRGTRQIEGGTVGVLQPDTAPAMMPGSVGLTRGCMPYQDPVYSQPKKLPGTHFHNAACGPLRKLIPLCRRCAMMLCTSLTSHSVSCVSLFCFHLFSSHLIFPSLLICYFSFLFLPLSPSALVFSWLSSSPNRLILSSPVNLYQ